MRYSFFRFTLVLPLLFIFVGCASQPLLLRNRPNVPPPLLAPNDSMVEDLTSPVVVPQIPSSSPALLPPPEIKAPQLTYTVVKGDSFWRVARKFGVDRRELAACNNLSLNKPLKIGVVLVIPPGGHGKLDRTVKKTSPWPKPDLSVSKTKKHKPASNKASTVDSIVPRTEDGTYVVRPHDSIWKIARRFGVKTTALVKANQLDPRKPIHPGMKLVIPGADGGTVSAMDTASPTGEETSSASTPVNSESDSDADTVDVESKPKVDNGNDNDSDLLDDAEMAVDSEKTTTAKNKKSVEDVLDELDSNSVDTDTSSEVPGAPYKEEFIPGDTLQSIADRHGCTVEEILKVNPNIKSEDDIKPFTSIIIPQKK